MIGIPLIFWFLIVCLLIYLFWLLLCTLGFKRFGIVFALTHFVIVLIIAGLVYKNLNVAQIQFFWFLLMALDYPIMFLYNTIKPLLFSFTGESIIAISVFVPFLFHGIFGTLLYYLIGRGMEYYTAKRIKKSSPG